MRTLVAGLSTGRRSGRTIALAVALAAGLTRVAMAEDGSLVSEVILDPSITVSAASPRIAPYATLSTGLVITPVFDGSITSDPNGATIMNTINSAIVFYESHITDPISVVIKFRKMGKGLGLSQTSVPCATPCPTTCGCGSITYSSYLTALTSQATSADDATALAHLAPGPNNPVNGNPNMWVKNANLRALGFVVTAFPGQPDSTISLNTKLCNLDRVTIDPMKFDLMAVVSHEIDEALGLGSVMRGPNGAAAPTGAIYPEDLFRYDQLGARSFNMTLSSQAFFSLDGPTQLARFNQDARGDFGDWYSPSDVPHVAQVQDAFATQGVTPNPVVELTALDVIGYTLGSATPPSQDDDTGFVPPDTNTETCEVGVAKNVRTIESCIEACHITAAAKAFAAKSFDEETCETSCRTRYNSKQTKLLTPGTCPACLDATHQSTLADQAETSLDSANGGVFCAGSVPFSGDDTGFVPPDLNASKCEAAVATNLKTLRTCIETCHLNAAIKAFKGKPFDEEGCQSADPKKSCRAKFNAKVTKLMLKGICPACLDAAQQATLADQVETGLDSGNGALFCAGSTPLPPPW